MNYIHTIILGFKMLWHSTAPQCGEDMEVAATHGSIQSPGKVITTKYYKQFAYALAQKSFRETQPLFYIAKFP